ERRVDDAIAFAPGLVESADSLAAEVNEQGECQEGERDQPELPVVVAVQDVTQTGRGGDAGQAEQHQNDGREATQPSDQGRESGKNENALAIASCCVVFHQL